MLRMFGYISSLWKRPCSVEQCSSAFPHSGRVPRVRGPKHPHTIWKSRLWQTDAYYERSITRKKFASRLARSERDKHVSKKHTWNRFAALHRCPCGHVDRFETYDPSAYITSYVSIQWGKIIKRVHMWEKPSVRHG